MTKGLSLPDAVCALALAKWPTATNVAAIRMSEANRKRVEKSLRIGISSNGNCAGIVAWIAPFAPVWGCLRWTSFWSSRYRFLPLRLDLLIGSAGEAVTNRDPFRLVGGKFDGDPVEGLAVQFVQRGVELCGVIISALWHALLESGAGVVSEPEIGAASFTGKMAAADEEDARARAVVFFVLARGPMGIFELSRRACFRFVILCFVNKRHAGAQDF